MTNDNERRVMRLVRYIQYGFLVFVALTIIGVYCIDGPDVYYIDGIRISGPTAEDVWRAKNLPAWADTSTGDPRPLLREWCSPVGVDCGHPKHMQADTTNPEQAHD